MRKEIKVVTFVTFFDILAKAQSGKILLLTDNS